MFPGVGGSLAFMRGSASFLFFPVGRPGCIGVGIVVPLLLGVPGVLLPGPVVFLGSLADFADLAAFALAWLVAPRFAVALAFFALAVLALAVLALGLLSSSLRAWLRLLFFFGLSSLAVFLSFPCALSLGFGTWRDAVGHEDAVQGG